MEKRVAIPENVEIVIDKQVVKVKGPKGELSKDFDDPRYNEIIKIEKDGEVVVKTDNEKRKTKSMIGTIASHIKNMITGVTVGFRYSMKIYYSHFPMNVSVKDNEVHVRNFLGEKGARIAKISGKAEVKVEKDIVNISGINVEDVGQTAANIEKICKLSKRDKRIFQDGIYLSGKFLQTGEVL